jgi:5-methylthioadenosine/S-adenosylhomocysteine deaminase
VIDARQGFVMPGLVNAHVHAAMTLFRGMADDLPLKEWLFDRIFPAEAEHLCPETVYWGALLGFLEMLMSGTTCFAEGYFFQDETFRAARLVGLRGLIAQGVIDLPAPDLADPRDNLKHAKRFLEKWKGASDRLEPGIFCHSLSTCSRQTIESAWEISQEFQLPMQIHLSETAGEVREVLKDTGMRPVMYLDALGLMKPDLIAAHAVHLDGKEIACMGERGAGAVHVPESNMKLASGVAQVAHMRQKGIPVGLGTDGCSSNNNLDLFGEMDTAAKLGKVMSRDPVEMDAKTVLRMATVEGAAVLGLEKEIGTLEAGKKADIVVVDLDKPHLCPVFDPYSLLVYSASGADVKDVVVNGEILLRDGKPTTVDPGEVMEKVREVAKNISR